jgi:transposase
MRSKQVAKSFVTLGFLGLFARADDKVISMKALRLAFRQRRQLELQLKSTRDVRLYRRTLAVLELERGRSVTEISRALQVSRPSVYRWMERYRESSAAGSLRDEERSGRPPAWTEECDEWLQSFLNRSPAELGYFAVNWTVPLLRDLLQMSLGKRFSDHTIRRGLRRLEYVWKRPRYVLTPDPEREKKTPNSPQNQALAAWLRPAGGRRDRCAAVSFVACQLEPTRPTGARADFGLECASSRLRRDESAHRTEAVSGSSTSTAA